MHISELKNTHLGKDCVILTCGPSLCEYSKDKILEFCKGKIVICVKEAIIEYKEIANYFVANTNRKRNYNTSAKTIKIFQCGPQNELSNETGYDITLPSCEKSGKEFWDEKKMLFNTKKFSDFNFNVNISRPWAMGIMYEIVFYLCQFMGVKNVYTIGWDLCNKNTPIINYHYFNKNDPKYKNSNGYQEFKKQLYIKEMIYVNENIYDFYKYFKNINMNISVIGKMSFVDKRIPRTFL